MSDPLSKVLVVGALGNCAMCLLNSTRVNCQVRRADVLIEGTGYCTEHAKLALHRVESHTHERAEEGEVHSNWGHPPEP